MKASRKKAGLLVAALAVGAGALVSGVATPAQAADGDEFIVNGDFSNYDPATGANLDGVTVTDFSLTTDLTEASFPGAGNMYDPGVYAIDTNAGSLHNQWVEQAGDNPKMVLNGFTEGVQTVWQQTAAGVTCDVPGSQIQFSFTAEVANVLPQDQYSDGGANIEVFINGDSIGSADLTSNDGTPVEISDGTVDAAAEFVIEIRNTATVYIGNDFSLDNLSLVQVGGCLTPVTPAFLAASPATCDAAGGFEGLVDPIFPLDRGDYTLSISPDFTGAGTYTLTATPDEGFAFPEGTVTTAQITIDPLGFELDCTPAVGGKTIGYYKNHIVTEASWDAIRASYPAVLGGLGDSWASGLNVLNTATSKDAGQSMLLAQFIATALNTNTITGYGAQEFVVPTTSAILPGETVTVSEYLAAINAGWASLDTKAERTSVQSVLNLINQDIASDLFV